ncbi:hypothetical protein SRIMM317S_05425 [Streptomyces rimosus subsp. rimosus]
MDGASVRTLAARAAGAGGLGAGRTAAPESLKVSFRSGLTPEK